MGSRLGDYARGEIGGNDEERRATVGLEMQKEHGRAWRVGRDWRKRRGTTSYRGAGDAETAWEEATPNGEIGGNDEE